MSTIPPILAKLTTTSHLKSLNIKKTTTYNPRNPVPGLEQSHKCGGEKRGLGSVANQMSQTADFFSPQKKKCIFLAHCRILSPYKNTSPIVEY
jgi:hypothetical protein